MTERSFPVPISLHVFNRPYATRKVFDVIRSVRPEKLFITADGPRTGVDSDIDNCAKVRSIVCDIDWECELVTRFSEENRGSFKSTSEGIDGVFQIVERAIILEDDCIPHPTFFSYCQQLLDRYENTERVSIITGNNFLLDKHSTPNSYHFSRYSHMWGWATWKRTWEKIDFSMANWPDFRDSGGLQRCFSRKHEVLYWHNIMQDMYEGRTGLHWDYLLILSMFMSGSLAVKPGVNLISNIGFGKDATHFRNMDYVHEVAVKAMEFPLVHPAEISRNILADDYVENHVFSRGRIYFCVNRLLKYLPQPMKQSIRKARRMLGLY